MSEIILTDHKKVFSATEASKRISDHSNYLRDTIKAKNNKGADQTVGMRELIRAVVISIIHEKVHDSAHTTDTTYEGRPKDFKILFMSAKSLLFQQIFWKNAFYQMSCKILNAIAA